MGIIIELPWPDKRLSPNARLHWAAVSKAKKAARLNAAYATYSATPHGTRDVRYAVAHLGRLPLKVTFYPPDRRQRDEDNLVASLKASLDGISDALGVNDAKFRATYVIAEPEKPGRVEVEIIHIGTVDISPCGATNGAESVIESGPELLRKQQPGPDQKHLARGARLMTSDTASDASAQAPVRRA